jgi:hypothetical protein
MRLQDLVLPDGADAGASPELKFQYNAFKAFLVSRWRYLSLVPLAREQAELWTAIREIAEKIKNLEPSEVPLIDVVRIVIGTTLLVKYSPVSQDVLELFKDLARQQFPFPRFILKCFARCCSDPPGPWSEFTKLCVPKFIPELLLGKEPPNLSVIFIDKLVQHSPSSISNYAACIMAFFGELACAETMKFPESIFRRFCGVLSKFPGGLNFDDILSHRSPRASQFQLLRCLLGTEWEFADFPFKSDWIRAFAFDESDEYRSKMALLLALAIAAVHGESPLPYKDHPSFGCIESITILLTKFPDYDIYELARPSLTCSKLCEVGLDHSLRFLEPIRSLVSSGANVAIKDLWATDEVQNELQAFVEAELKHSPSPLLKVLSQNKLFDFDENRAKRLVPSIIDLFLHSKNPKIRSLAAKALKALNLCHDNWKILFDSALLEPSSDVRASIFDSFVPFPERLAVPDTIKRLTLFLNEPSSSVQRSVINVLCSIPRTDRVSSFFTDLSGLDVKFLSAHTLSEQSSLIPVLLHHFGVTDKSRILLDRSIQVLNTQTQSEKLTIFETRYRALSCVSSLRTVRFILRHDFTTVESQISELMDVFLRLLKQVRAPREISLILKSIDMIVHRLGVTWSRDHATLYSTLFQVGQQFVPADIHTLLFRILGYIGIKPLSDPISTSVIGGSLFEVESKYPRYSLERCLSVMLHLIESDGSYALLRHTLNLFLHTTGRKDAVPLFGEFMKVFWPRVNTRDEFTHGMLADLCQLPADWIRPELPTFVSKIVELGEISVVAPLAGRMSHSLGAHLPQLAAFAISAEVSPASLSALTALGVHGRKAKHTVAAIVSHLLAWSDFPGAFDSLTTIVARGTQANSGVDISLCALQLGRFSVSTGKDRMLASLHAAFPEILLPPKFTARKLSPPKIIVAGVHPDAFNRSAYLKEWPTSITDHCASEVSPGWLAQFEYLCLCESPDPLVRECLPIARDHPIVIKRLFQLAFLSLARRANSQHEVPACVVDVLLKIVMNPKSPRESIVTITALLEFLDRIGKPLLGLHPCDKPPEPGPSDKDVGKKSSNKDAEKKKTDKYLPLIPADFPGLALCLRSALSHYDVTPNGAAIAHSYRAVGMLSEASLFGDQFFVSVEPLAKKFGLSSVAAMFESLGKTEGPNFVQGFSAIVPAIATAQSLVELEESDGNWSLRLAGTTSLFHIAQQVLLRRIDRIGDAIEEKSQLLHLACEAHEWTAFAEYYGRFFCQTESLPDSVIRDKIKFLWGTGKPDEAMVLLEQTLAKQENLILLAQRAHYAMRLYSAASPDFSQYLRPLEGVKKNRECVIAWALSCLKLKLAKQAFATFVQIVRDFDDWRISDVLELIKIAFTGSVTDDEVKAIFDVPLHAFLPVLNYLIPKQNRCHKRETYRKLIVSLVRTFPYGVVFPIQFSLKSDITGGAKPYLSKVCAEFEDHPAFTDAEALLRVLDAIALPLRTFIPGAIKTLYKTICDYTTAVTDGKRNQIRGRYKFVKERFLSVLHRRCRYDTKLVDAKGLILQQVTKHVSNLLEGIDADIEVRRKWLAEMVDQFSKPGKTPAVLQEQEGDFDISQFCSDEMLKLDFHRVPVFGHFTHARSEQITITKIDKTVRVLNSRQRPRKITFVGSDGLRHSFLLKANDDLRTDERAMQFFSLVNQIHSERSRIRTYAIAPLTADLGIIQWVPNADTFASLLDHVKQRPQISLDDSFKVLLDFFGSDREYEPLSNATRIQKLEIYEAAVPVNRGNTRPLDALREVMWITAVTSERWLRFQATFTNSLAVMSIVGHVIGLGDRHLNNIMLDQSTGTVVHIDFGMALDSAKLRDKTPETVSFRATPVIGAACGPMGFNGAFRKMCEMTHSSVTAKRESVLTVLEIFRDDPINPGSGFPQALGQTVSQRGEAEERGNQHLTRMIDRLEEGSEKEVAKLITEATDPYNLSQMYPPWLPWW